VAIAEPEGGAGREAGPGSRRTLRAVLDANVLYPQFLRDVLLRLAASDLYVPLWSERIQEEWSRNVLLDRPDLPQERLALTRRRMDEAFPGALVVGVDVFESKVPEEVDHKDRHVAAAAIRGRADRIVTENVRDFPREALEPLGIVPVRPDSFLADLARADEETVRLVLEAHRVGLLRPPHSRAEYVAAFRRANLNETTDLLWC
jgi:hypothetical protein